MIGQRVESRHGIPWGAVLLLMAGLGLGGVALAIGSSELAVGAVLPLALGGSFWLLGLERPFTATFHEEGLEIEGTPGLVPYASLQSVWAAGRSPEPADFRKRSCTLQVRHDRGWLRIPARLTVPSSAVYRFLTDRVPRNGSREVNPVLAEYLERQERYFGPENVWTFRATSHRASGERLRGLRVFSVGLFVTGVAWMAFGFSGFGGTEWGLAGIFATALAAMFFSASFTDTMSAGRVVKNWRQSSLVIGPQGMAMVQGDVQGEVHWSELLDVRTGARHRNFALSYQAALHGILLKVKGANILIADIYDRPLYVIYDRILAASGRLNAPADAEL